LGKNEGSERESGTWKTLGGKEEIEESNEEVGWIWNTGLIFRALHHVSEIMKDNEM
jgi:hypothetical protein